jgi:diaminohydroxyphosphoribosylaminopyrimidine deaminase/5-amino-6-(5-phosphoribosylamino)uracil reductase
MQRCLDLAANAIGNTYPNPMVGSVVVYKDEIIGEGWHQKAGMPHAEVNAINSVKDKSLLKKATIYVSLEPCSHFGKTPPCADLIIAHKIPKVVIGCLDPNEKVAGRGIKKLLDAGCKVTLGMLEEEAQNLNKRFFTFHKKQRPYIVLKWAETADGFVAPHEQITGKPFWITSAASKQLVHKWRSEEHTILIGTKTALKDNPQLNNRLWEGRSPIRIVLDRTLKIPKSYHLYDLSEKTIIITEKTDGNTTENLVFETIEFSENSVENILKVLWKHQIQSVIIEGGVSILNVFITEGLWDEARVFIGEKKLADGIKAPQLHKNPTNTEKIATDQLKWYYND